MQNRTRLTALTLCALITGAAAGCSGDSDGGGGGDKSKDSVTIFDWGGPTGHGYEANNIRALYTPCSEELGISFTVDEPMDYSKIRAALSSGNVPWDIMNVQNDFGDSPEELVAIDYSVVDADKFSGDYAQPYRVGSDTQATSIGYNAELFPDWDGLTSFFDTTNYPGKRGVPKSLFAGLFEVALVADGVSPDDLYPLDLDRAFAKLDLIRDDLVYWDTGATAQSLLASGEVVAIFTWQNRLDDAISIDEAPFAIVTSQWIQTDDYWVIPKGAKHVDAAQRFIECITDPKKQVDWANEIVFGPTTTEALNSPDLESNPNRPTNYMEGQIKVDDAWWTENFAAVAERWNAWMVS